MAAAIVRRPKGGMAGQPLALGRPHRSHSRRTHLAVANARGEYESSLLQQAGLQTGDSLAMILTWILGWTFPP